MITRKKALSDSVEKLLQYIWESTHIDDRDLENESEWVSSMKNIFSDDNGAEKLVLMLDTVPDVFSIESKGRISADIMADLKTRVLLCMK